MAYAYKSEICHELDLLEEKLRAYGRSYVSHQSDRMPYGDPYPILHNPFQGSNTWEYVDLGRYRMATHGVRVCYHMVVNKKYLALPEVQQLIERYKQVLDMSGDYYKR